MTPAERAALMGLADEWTALANIEDSLRWNTYYEGRVDALDACADRIRALLADMGEGDGPSND